LPNPLFAKAVSLRRSLKPIRSTDHAASQSVFPKKENVVLEDISLVRAEKQKFPKVTRAYSARKEKDLKNALQGMTSIL
jgi:hypothetical protein